MPDYNVAIGKRTYKVELIKKKEDFFKAKINDKPVEMKIKVSKLRTPSHFTIIVAEQEYEIKAENIRRQDPFKLDVNNIQFTVELSEPQKKPIMNKQTVQTPIIKHQKLEDGAVVAPMAGKIITIKVKKGDDVKVGDAICTLEAMKMENEIVATKTGKIQEINVSEGSPVNERDIIATIK